MKRIFLPLFSLFFLCLNTLQADPLSLAELIDIALKNNPETEKVWSNVKRAQATLDLSRSPQYPHLDAQGSATHAREVKFPNGPDTTFTSYGGELNLNYLLCDFGENRAAVRSTKEGLRASKWWADFAIQKVIAEVASNYYQLLNAQELLATQESSIQDTQVVLSAAHELRDAGLKPESDCITVRAAISQAKMDIARQQAAVAIARGRLLMTLGLPVDDSIDVQTAPEGLQNPLFEEGISKLLDVASEQRADLMAKQAEFAGLDAQVTRASRAPLPKLRVLGQGGWLQYEKRHENGYNYSAGVALDIPLFHGFAYTAEKKQALAEVDISAAELRALQNAVSLEVLSYSEQARAASDVMHYSEEFFADALQSYTCNLESYKAGLINVFDLLLAQRHLADARTRKALARTEWLVSLSQLAFATGSPSL